MRYFRSALFMLLLTATVAVGLARLASADSFGGTNLLGVSNPPYQTSVNAFTGEKINVVAVGTHGPITITTDQTLNPPPNILAVYMQCYDAPVSPEIYPSTALVMELMLYYYNGLTANFMLSSSGDHIEVIAGGVHSITFQPLSSATLKQCSYNLHRNPNR